VVGVSCWGTCCRLFSEAFSEEISLKYSLLAENGSDLKFRHLSHVNIGGSGGGGLVSVVGVSCWGTCCRLFSEAFSEEITRIYCLARERERFEFRHLSHVNIGVAAEGVWCPVVGVSCWGTCCRLFLRRSVKKSR
jgi:hypothetical protein